jgi:hypothetical protein
MTFKERFAQMLRQAGVSAIAAALSLAFAAGPAAAGDHGRSAGDSRRSDYESKIYGTVEKLPQGEVGTWIVNGREIVVTKDTRIKEKHGKAEAGAYVEVEGNGTGNTFTAYEIEVKRAK